MTARLALVSRSKKLGLAARYATVTGLLAVSIVSAQAPAVFEVASIRLKVPKERELIASGQLSISGPNVTGLMRVRDLIIYGYSIGFPSASQVSSTFPSWVGTDLWDIRAKVPGDGPATNEQVRMMVRALLADRFQLKLTEEMNDTSVYQLVIEKGGSRLRPLADPADPSVLPSRRVARGDGVMEWGEGKQTLRSLIGLIAGFTDRPIVNMTGMGNTDTVVAGIQFVPDKLLASPDAPAGPSVYKAVEEQLGLKLEAVKMPIETFIIERVEKPSEN